MGGCDIIHYCVYFTRNITGFYPIGTLLDATSREQIRLSASPARARLNDAIDSIRRDLTSLMSSIYARIDYPDEDLGEFTDEESKDTLIRIRESLKRLIDTYRTGRAINEGISTVICGKPNVGKSSLVNKLLGENRSIVSNIPGTTRDAIDTPFNFEGKDYVLIDTAGIRRKKSIDSGSLERYSVIRSLDAIRRADVVLVVLDASQGMTEQDVKIAGFVKEHGKAALIVVNKWDLIEKDNSTVNEFTRDINTSLAYMSYAPILFVSAKTGQRVREIYKHIDYVYNQTNTRVPTGMLNDVLGEATMRVQPPSDKGRRLKIYYMTQVSVAPPTFVIFCNDVELFHFSYRRYIENCIRDTFGFKGTPIHIIIRQKGDEV